jgi:hypothetical protein
MKLFRLVLLTLTIAACGGGGGEDPPPIDSTPQDSSGAACTNADYDPCTTNDECTSGNCHFFNQSAFTVCVPACGGGTPCPDDSTGNPGTCNNMGICKPAVANDCAR